MVSFDRGFCTQSRWRHSVTVTVKDGGYVLLWKRYDNNKMADMLLWKRYDIKKIDKQVQSTTVLLKM